MAQATAKKTVKRRPRKATSQRLPDGEPTLQQALKWLSGRFPSVWSPKAVCRWVAEHPVVHRLLLARLQAFADILKSGIDIDDVDQLESALAALGEDDK